jgi:hypothetical protein
VYSGDGFCGNSSADGYVGLITSWREGTKARPALGDPFSIFYLYFLFILQNYTTILNFIRFDHQPIAMGNDGWRSNRRGPRQLCQQSWPIRREPRRQ